MRTMILFLSQLSPDAEPAEYHSDFGKLPGLQTNEAPVQYALKRLAATNKKLDRVIILLTPQARETAYARFCETVNAASPGIELAPVEIADNVTVTDLLNATIGAMFPVASGDSVIIETTGGYRNAINALTLFSRFLRYSGVRVDFSTFSDFRTKTVLDTYEEDELFELLDAVNLFAVTGNPHQLLKCLKNIWSIPRKTAFVRAIRGFYNSILCCKTSELDDVVADLRAALDSIACAEIAANDPKMLIFRDLVREIVSAKMEFIYDDDYLLGLVDWCKENGLMQQAVTILFEKIIKEGKTWNKLGDDGLVLRFVRNSFNHANGEVNIAPEQISDAKKRAFITEEVKNRLSDVNNLVEFIDHILNRIRKP